MINKIGNWLLKVLTWVVTSPFLLIILFVDFFDRVRINYDIFKDRLFMKRFALLDEKHIIDFVKWNNKYKTNRRNKTAYQKNRKLRRH